MSNTDPLPFHAFMLARRPEVVEKVDEDITARLARYSGVSEAERRASIDALVGIFLDALASYQPDAVARWITERLEGVPLDELLLDSNLKVIAIARDGLARAARPLVERGVAGAWEGLSLFSTVSDAMTSALSACFVDRLSSTLRAWRATEERYRALYLSTPAMMHSTDQMGVLVTVNDRWLKVLGYERDEVIGKRCADFMTEESCRYAIEVGVPDLIHTGASKDKEYDFITKSGEIVHVLSTSFAERDEAGAIVGAIAVLIDVTERRKAERSLRESEIRYRSIVELSPLGILVHRDGKLVYLNPAATRLFGAQSAEELIGTPTLNRVHPDSRDEVRGRIERLTAVGSEVTSTERVCLRVDGTPVHVEAAAASIMYEGAPAVQAVIADISARKRVEEARSQSALQDEVIRMQEATLRALSTPLIPISDHVIVMPLVGSIDAGRAARILEALLRGVVAHRASIAILDVTGVPELDEDAVDALLRATRAVKLLGAEAVLTGISPASAQALVQAGADLGAIAARGTLKDGIRYAQRGAAWR